MNVDSKNITTPIDEAKKSGVSNAETLSQSGLSTDKSELDRGRTIWDFLSERITERRTTGVSYSKIIFSLVILFFTIYSIFQFIMDGFEKGYSHLTNVEFRLDKIYTDLTIVRSNLGKAPSSAGTYISQPLDIIGCKARSIEALERLGGKGINASQQSAVSANFDANSFGFSCNTVIHCLDKNKAYIYTVSQDGDFASLIRDKVKDQFQLLTKETDTHKPKIVGSGKSKVRKTAILKNSRN